MSPDYYKAAEQLAQMLKFENRPDAARQLEETILAGMASTEVLMGLAYQLRQLLSGDELSDTTRSAAQALLVQIDQALM